MWDRAYGNNLYVLFFLPFWKKWLKNYWHFVTGEYNSEVFAFGDSSVRKLLADIQVEEQNHAEMLYKYKTVNGMV